MIKTTILAALIGIGIAGCGHGAPAHEPPTPAPTQKVIQEDDPAWNCLTRGNRRCGPSFVPLTEEDKEQMDEGEVPSRTRQSNYAGCLIEWADTDTVVCPDGYLWHS